MAASPTLVPAIAGIADYVTARAGEQANWHADRVRTHERLVADVERVLATQNQSWASLISQG